MRRYRKIDPRIWSDEKFVRLNEGEKLLTLYILTAPQANRIGCFRFSIGMAAEDLGCSPNALANRFETVCQTLGWEFSEQVRLLFIPTWTRYQPPENPNQVKGWAADFHALPDDALKLLCYQSLQDVCREIGKGLPERFTEAFGKPPSNGKANQEQEQEQEQENCTGPPSGKPDPQFPSFSDTARHAWSAYVEAHERYHRQKNGKRAVVPKLTEKRKRKLVDLAKEGYNEADLADAARGVFVTPWNTGKNPDGREYLSPDLVFRDGEKVERFAEQWRRQGNGQRPRATEGARDPSGSMRYSVARDAYLPIAEYEALTSD